MVTQERTPVSPEDEAADVYAACDRIDASAAKMMSSARLTLHPSLETSPELLALIERAKGHKMTPEEIDAQRRSWVRGQMGLRHAPEQIDAALNAMLGPPLSAQLAAAREAGRLEGLNEALTIAENVAAGTPYAARKSAANRIIIYIRAKMEGK